MSDVELDPRRKGSTADPGRARKRKLKREGQPVPSSHTVLPARQRRTSRQASPGTSSSTREQQVSQKVRLPSISLPKIPDELNLKKIPGMKMLTGNRPLPGSDLVSGVTRRGSHRREPKHTENLYEASAHTETQRKTRTRSEYTPRTTRRTFESRTEDAPPVMVRGGLGGMAFGRVASSKLNKRKPPKRRIDVPLNVPGAELRLPSIPILHIGWRAVSFLMVLMMIASLVLIWKAPAFKVGAMKAEGLERLTLSDLNAVMRVSGESVFTIDPQKLDRALQLAFPELSKISVKVNLPASVKVVVSERKPVIAWIQDNTETWVDANGISFPARGTISDTLVKVEGYGTPPGLIQAASTGALIPTGEITPTVALTSTLRLSPDLVSAILALGEKMPPDTLLVYDSDHGLGWNDPKGWDVFFGTDDQDMEMKLAVYQSLVDRLESQGIQPALISVEYVHAPYYRMER